MNQYPDLLGGPPPTLLPPDPASAELAGGADPRSAAASHPASSQAWSRLADDAFSAGDPVASYAFARTGYHRGLDALRRAGWKGSGPVPWRHDPNRGFLRCVYALARAAAAIGETDEATRCQDLLSDSDPAALDALSGAGPATTTS